MDSFSISEIFSPVQLLAWAATILFLISFQKQSSEKTILFWVPADIFMTLHFFFMGAPLLMIVAIGGFFRSIIALKMSKKFLKYYLILYTLSIFLIAPFLGSELKDFFAVIGTMFFSLSVWFKYNFLVHRTFAFAHQVTWVFVFLLIGSYGGLALIITMFVSNVIGTGRYIVKRNSQ